MLENSREALFCAIVREYFPSKSVADPLVVPARTTIAPITGSPFWSTTLPVTVLCAAETFFTSCAYALIDVEKIAATSASIDIIVLNLNCFIMFRVICDYFK